MENERRKKHKRNNPEMRRTTLTLQQFINRTMRQLASGRRRQPLDGTADKREKR